MMLACSVVYMQLPEKGIWPYILAMSTNQAILGSSNKLDIIKCVKPSVVQDEETVFDCKTFGG